MARETGLAPFGKDPFVEALAEALAFLDGSPPNEWTEPDIKGAAHRAAGSDNELYERLLKALRADRSGPDANAKMRPIDLGALLRGEYGDSFDWLVSPLLLDHAHTGLVGERGDGKSLISQFVAFGLASGREVLGRSSGNPLTVVVFDYEQTLFDIYDRATAFGYTPDSSDFLTLIEHLKIYQVGLELPPLNTKEGAELALELVDAHRAALVIVDSAVRAVDGEENDSSPWRDVYRFFEQPLKVRGVSMLRTDQLGKDRTKKSRGSSGKEDGLDVIWQLSRSGEDSLELTATKRRQLGIPEKVRIRLVDDNDLLRFEITDEPPPHVVEILTDIQELGVDPRLSANQVEHLLKMAGKGRRRRHVQEAHRWYRNRGNQPQAVPGTSQGTTQAPGATSLDLERELAGNHRGNHEEPGGGGVPPPKGGTTTPEAVNLPLEQLPGSDLVEE